MVLCRRIQTCDPPENRRQIQQAARAFGAYQRALAGVEIEQLVETIQVFEHVGYLRHFDQVLALATQAEREQAALLRWPSRIVVANGTDEV